MNRLVRALFGEEPTYNHPAATGKLLQTLTAKKVDKKYVRERTATIIKRLGVSREEMREAIFYFVNTALQRPDKDGCHLITLNWEYKVSKSWLKQILKTLADLYNPE